MGKSFTVALASRSSKHTADRSGLLFLGAQDVSFSILEDMHWHYELHFAVGDTNAFIFGRTINHVRIEPVRQK